MPRVYTVENDPAVRDLLGGQVGIRDDVSLVKVTVSKKKKSTTRSDRSRSRSRQRSRPTSRPRSNSRPRSISRNRSLRSASKSFDSRRGRGRSVEKNRYFLGGKGKNVVLEFTQDKTNDFGGGRKSTGRAMGKSSNSNARYSHHKSRNGKALGESVGVSEFKRRVKDKANAYRIAKWDEIANQRDDDEIDDTLLDDIDELRQMNEDPTSYIDDQNQKQGGTEEQNENEKDSSWFNLDNTKEGNDYYNNFLKSVQCNAYTMSEGCGTKESENISAEVAKIESAEKTSFRPSSMACGSQFNDGEKSAEKTSFRPSSMACGSQFNDGEKSAEKTSFRPSSMACGSQFNDAFRSNGEEVINDYDEDDIRENNQKSSMTTDKEEEEELNVPMEMTTNYPVFERDLDDDLREIDDEQFRKEQMDARSANEESRNIEQKEDYFHQSNDEEEFQQSNLGEEDEPNKKMIEKLQELSVLEEEDDDETMYQSKLSPSNDSSGDSPNDKTKLNWFERIVAKIPWGVKCGEDFDLLDIFADEEDKLKVPLGVEGERRLLYPANDHVDSPPTALYAAIGTKQWNIALRRLLEEPKEASMWVKNASEDGQSVFRFLPLHIACLSGAPLLLITLLVQTYPNAVKYNAMGKLPIHMACEVLADHRVVFLLLNSWPESLEARDEDGFTPIEIASEFEQCEERNKIVQVLTKKMECSVVKTPTALYSYIDSQNWTSAMMRLVEMPQESTTWVSFATKYSEVRFLPLHIACMLGAPFLLIKDLVESYPDAVRKKTTQGQLPLHIACQSHVDERVVGLLLDFWPEGLFVKDDDGNTAIEVASNSEYSPEKTAIIAILQKKLEHQDRIVYAPTKLYKLIEERKWDIAVRHCLENPDEVSTWVGQNPKKNDARLLPIHLACSLRAPLILVAVLVQTSPEGVKRTDNSGMLPIHIACQKRADHRVVSLLLHAWAESCREKDENGNTPIQTALLSTPSDERTKIVETLMAFESKNGEALVIPNGMFDVQREAANLVQQSRDIRSTSKSKDGAKNLQTGHRRSSSKKPKKITKSLRKNRKEMFTSD
ncbi:hypothetical protein CTEN210_17290 [Chaetoceros tenuissimus]|uniref:Uncharacterized protein n=1 Tax=Chaetoceros tenuissimus TaxID=426638 RepID=A0AAD3HF37_9STRA|nr:hypothetical protein CTEN210_17290 [Chaetoceros tenuissimus]